VRLRAISIERIVGILWMGGAPNLRSRTEERYL
jgi:hypothetical protein